jgi:hypothetical protein
VGAARRLAALVAAVAVAGAMAASPAGAQQQPDPSAPAASAPAAPDPAATTTTIPAGCTAPLPVALLFVGKVVAGDSSVARFQVQQVRQGTPPGPMVDVDYGDTDDRRFIADGKTYLVAAALDPESSRFESKVRIPRTEAKACAQYDQVFTNNADGSHIDSSVLAGLQGKWGDIAAAFLIPAGIIFGVLLGLVIVKHTFLLTGRGVRYARARHRSRPSRPAGRGPAAPEPPLERRTRTHTGPRAPG